MSDSFESWWEINHRSLPVHDPKELARVMYGQIEKYRSDGFGLSNALASLQGFVRGEEGDTITKKAENKIQRLERELTHLRIYAESARKELAQRDERIKELMDTLDVCHEALAKAIGHLVFTGDGEGLLAAALIGVLAATAFEKG